MKKSKNKNVKLLLAILISIVVFFGVEYVYLAHKSDNIVLPDYYKNLSTQCPSKQSDSCCMNSVSTMAENNYELATDGSCPAGFKPNTLKCEESLTWCQPE